jgi:thymidylate synthase (FAD)
MEVDLVEGSMSPEYLVCRCARGDYRREPVTNEYSDTEILEDIDAKDKWIKRVEEDDATFLPEGMDYVDFESLMLREARKMTLIERLFRKRHMGVFEHPTATFAVEGISRACMAQLTRHRHASFDVQSMRYVDFGDVNFAENIVYGASNAQYVALKEQLEEYAVVPDSIFKTENWKNVFMEYYLDCIDSFERYDEMTNGYDIPKEDARMMLPVGTKVNLTFTMNARSIMHLLDMRKKANAQWEIRELSEKLLDECKDWMPTTFELYEEDHPNKLQA